MTFEPVGASVEFASAAMQQSALSFKWICDTAPVGLCLLDHQFRFIYLNQMYADMNGVPIAAHIGRTPREVVPHLGDQAEAAFQDIMESGKPLHGIEVSGVTHANQDVTRVWEESWVPMMDDVGRIIGIVISAVDITMRKEAEMKLKHLEAEANLRAEALERESKNKSAFIAQVSPILDGIAEATQVITERRLSEKDISRLASFPNLNPNPIVEIDLDGRIIFINPAAQKMFPDLEKMEKDHAWLVDWMLVAKIVCNNPSASYTRDLLIGDKWYHQAISFIPEVQYIRIYGQDITERKQAEEKLMNALQVVEKRSQELAAMIASIPDGLVIYDSDLTPVYLNDAAKLFFERYQISYKDEFSVRARTSRIMAEDGRLLKKEEWALYRTFIHGETVSNFVQMSANQDDRPYYTSISSAPIHDEQGRVTGAVVTLKDITAQKQAENRLRQSEQEANRLVQQLQEADRNKNHFISMLSHELRNPLATIIMSQELLKCLPPDSETASRARDSMDRQMRLLKRLVDDLLDVTRISENKIKLNLERVDLVSLIGRSLIDFQAGFEAKDVHLHSSLPEAPVFADVDPERIIQIIGNLLHNALKFTRKGDGVCVSLTVDVKMGMAIVSITDTGSGIEPEFIRQMFNPFIQADRSLARTQGGLGLGLSIVKGIVELHGGRVGAQSEGIGKGATFTFWLPLMEGAGERLHIADMARI